VTDDQKDFEDIPPPPLPEFDRDAEYALASPGLWKEERAGIIGEARSLLVGGLSREAVSNWICREVARTVGGRSGFVAVDADGEEIDSPQVVAARKELTSRAGRKSQTKRNADLEKWRQRCEQLIAAGDSKANVWHRCWAAINATHMKAAGKPATIPAGFESLPALYGRDGKSPPANEKRLRARILGRRSAH
jgi:hypothetical protein